METVISNEAVAVLSPKSEDRIIQVDLWVVGVIHVWDWRGCLNRTISASGTGVAATVATVGTVAV